ncbi:hypothetical protein [Niabella beijingensis]|uniref:hypothetical protein n=1 Tax=Niabella beijingensis TaxID=2872700 RepID=UPI001CBC5811|nr:hypothetical protein [Niabella beijingensis]MBZ4192654.1 hypothetical protein [Niabella beijingensis]
MIVICLSEEKIFAQSFENYKLSKKKEKKAAAIKNYRFTFQESRTRKSYTIDVGLIETGMPYKTYKGDIIPASTAQSIAVQAASMAERDVVAVVAAQVITNPTSPIDNQYYRAMFKNEYKSYLNEILRNDYYDNENVNPATVLLSSDGFSVAESDFVELKFFGRDC